MLAVERPITAREVLLLCLGASAISVVMNWPLALHLGTTVPRDIGDPLVQSWEIAWDGHALAHQPLNWFESNQFWPLHDSLAFSDALLGYAPAGLIGSGVEAAIFRYDVMFLFAYALAFVGAYLLARELGVGPAGAAVAGAAFAFAPFRLEQDGHMAVISSGGIPLSIALGLHGYRLHRAWLVLVAWIVATWQLTLGFTLGMPLSYLIATLCVLAAIVWWRRGRPPPDRSLVVATAVGAVIFVGMAALIGRAYIEVVDRFPEARRSPSVIESFSGPPTVFLAAPEENWVWGDATRGLRDRLENIPEETLFPGLAILALAAAGLASPAYPRRLRVGLAIGVVFVSVLALGFRASDSYLYPYRIVYDLPGWNAIRAVGRIVTFSSLGLALLAAMGAELALRRAGSGRGRWVGPAIAGGLVLVILVEGRGLPFNPLGERAQPVTPDPHVAAGSIPAPQLNLPALRPEDNRRYVLWSTDGFPDMVNGRSSLNPLFTHRAIERSRGFPDRRSVRLLRDIGVRSVVLHTKRVEDTPWSHAARRPVWGLDLTRRRKDDVIVYEIGSPRAPNRALVRSLRRSR